MRTHSYGFAYILIDINELPRRSWPVVQTSEDSNWATQQNMGSFDDLTLPVVNEI